MQHGWRWQRSTSRECEHAFGYAAGWRWSRAAALLCSRQSCCHARANVRAYWCCCAHRRGLCVVENVLRGQSEPCRMSPFLDLSRSPSQFLSRSLSLDLWLSLSGRSAGPWFLLRTTPKVPPPHDAGVGCARMAVRITVGKDRFLVLVRYQGLLYTLRFSFWRWRAKRSGHNFAPGRCYQRWKKRQALRRRWRG